MFEKLISILAKTDGDYADLRYEIKRETWITFDGKELASIGSGTTDGYVLRILKDGGFSSISFTRETDGDRAIRIAQGDASIISKNRKDPVRLAGADVIQDMSFPDLEEDPRKITMEEKLDLTRNYNNIPLQNQKVVSTNISYREVIRNKYFMTTEGTRIREDLITTSIGGIITVKSGNSIQSVRCGLGGSNGFKDLRNGEDEFEKRTSLAVRLLDAKPVESGLYSVLLNPRLAGIFTHEAFGHFSEADLIEDLPTMREKMRIGNMLGSDLLSIKDDPTLPGQLGFYKYDDEGVRARPTQLMKNGVLTGRLHSRRTAASFGEPLTGHCVAEDSRYAPIIRMGTIFIEPGKESPEELLENLNDGYYFLDSKGGQTSGENFTFGAQYGYRVQKGKVRELVRDINLSGNLYESLQNTHGIGIDLQLSKIGGCGKGQMNMRSCFGAPHILIKNVVVGGI